MNKRACIITGGKLNPAFLSEHLSKNRYDVCIVVDGALEVTHDMNLCPDYIVGDFDTVDQSLLAFYPEDKILRHLPEKDQTDTELAIETAVRAQCREIVFLGATGSRLDHSLANIFLLEKLKKQGLDGMITDEQNRLYVRDKSFSVKKSEVSGNYFSLLPLTETVEGVTLTGFKYPVQDMTFYRENTLGISNEIKAETATVSFRRGFFLVIESQDEKQAGEV